MFLDASPATAPPSIDVALDNGGDGSDLSDVRGPFVDPPRPLLRRLAFPVAVSLLLQLVIAAGERLPSVDGTAYFEAGRNLLGGNGFTRRGDPELHFPPLTPIALGGLERITGSELAALRIWNLSCGLLVLAAIILLARQIWKDDDTTVVAAWLGGTVAGLIPLFSRQGGGSESISVATLLFAAYFAIRALSSGTSERRRLLGLAAAGLAVGLSYLARPESLLPGAILGAGVAFDDLRRPGSIVDRGRRLVLWCGAFGLPVLLCAFPYLAYLHGHTGKWSPTAKSQDASIGAWRAVAENNRLERDRVLYAVNSSGTGLGVPTESLTTLAREDPTGWLGIVWVNIKTIFRFYVMPEFSFGPSWRMIPGFLLIPAAMEAWRSRRRRSLQILGAMALGPLATCVAFFTLPRYLVLTTAVITLLAARGLVVLLRRWSPGWRRLAIVVTVVFMATSTIAEVEPFLPWGKTTDPVEQAAAGRWIEENTPAASRIMTRSFHVQAYANRPVVAMPASDYATMLKFARRMGVDYVVADEATVSRRRPELYAALMTWDDPPGLELVKSLTERGEEVRIFRLDPLPPPSDRPPIPLGYVSD